MDQINPQQYIGVTPSLNPATLAYQPPKHPKRKIFIAALCIVLVVFSGLFVFNKLQKSSERDELQSTEQIDSPKAPNQTIKLPSSADQDSELDSLPVIDSRGFSMKMPKGWTELASLEAPGTGAGYIHLYNQDEMSKLGIFINITPMEGTSIEKLFEEDTAGIKANKDAVAKVTEMRNFKNFKAGFHETEIPKNGTTALTATTYQNNRVYTIGLQAYTKDWNKYKPIYLKVLDTVKFEKTDPLKGYDATKPLSANPELDSMPVTNTTGFSIAKPKGWISDVSPDAPGNQDGGFSITPGGQDPSYGIYVYVIPVPLDPKDDSPEVINEMLQEMKKTEDERIIEMQANGAKVQPIENISYPNYFALYYESEIPAKNVSSLSVITYKKGKVYRINLVGATNDWAVYRPFYQKVLDSVKID